MSQMTKGAVCPACELLHGKSAQGPWGSEPHVPTGLLFHCMLRLAGMLRSARACQVRVRAADEGVCCSGELCDSNSPGTIRHKRWWAAPYAVPCGSGGVVQARGKAPLPARGSHTPVCFWAEAL